jgi:hypothetical protein
MDKFNVKYFSIGLPPVLSFQRLLPSFGVPPVFVAKLRAHSLKSAKKCEIYLNIVIVNANNA